MLRLLLFVLLVLGLGFMFAWVADRPGTLTVEWMNTSYEVSLMVALTALVVLVSVIIFIWSILRGMIRTPAVVSNFFQSRRRDRGYAALSRGLIAASSGDVDTARMLARESGKLLKNEPLVSLLGAQTALLDGKRDEARANFQAMLGEDNTKLVALRGLFLEAERQGEAEAARHYAIEAVSVAPSLPWASLANLRYQAVDGDWDEALKTLEANRAAGLIERDKAKRQHAVLLTAKAMQEETANPDEAIKLTKQAHKLAKDLIPAAVVFARAATRQGDIRGATRILEATWKLAPHPELAEAYIHVRSGDSVTERLKRANRLAKLKPKHPESGLVVTLAAIDALDWPAARAAIEPVLTNNLTERACLVMADLEEAEHGDKGRMRDWLSRAVRAPADPAWTADGQVSPEWLPLSPVSGEIDAFEWKVPVERLGGSDAMISVEDLTRALEPETVDIPEVEATDSELDSADIPQTSKAEVAEILEEPGKDTKPKEENSEKPASDKKQVPEPANDAKSENVEFPLERRPDDPGIRPDTQAKDKQFKQFQ